jgi:hypothetical protein
MHDFLGLIPTETAAMGEWVGRFSCERFDFVSNAENLIQMLESPIDHQYALSALLSSWLKII